MSPHRKRPASKSTRDVGAALRANARAEGGQGGEEGRQEGEEEGGDMTDGDDYEGDVRPRRDSESSYFSHDGDTDTDTDNEGPTTPFTSKHLSKINNKLKGLQDPNVNTTATESAEVHLKAWSAIDKVIPLRQSRKNRNRPQATRRKPADQPTK